MRKSMKSYSLYQQDLKTGMASLVWDYRRNSDNERIRVALSFDVHASFFDKATGFFRADTPNAVLLNNRLKEVNATIEAAKIEGIGDDDLREMLGARKRIKRSNWKTGQPTVDEVPTLPNPELNEAIPAPDYRNMPPKDIFFDNRQQELDAEKEDAPPATIADEEAGWIVINTIAMRITGARDEEHALRVLDDMAKRNIPALVYQRKYAAQLTVQRIKY